MRHPENLEYRNKIDLVSIENIAVDAGSLWVLKNGILVLEDNDQYATHLLTDNFEKAYNCN